MSLLIIPDVGAGDVSVVEITITAGEDLTIRDCVYVDPYPGTETSGRAYKTDANAVAKSETAWVVGFATETKTAGNAVTVRIAGALAGFTGLTSGGLYYCSETDGEITLVPPSFSRIIAIAINTTTIIINSQGNRESVGIVGSATKGYFAGGNSGTYTVTAEKITFVSDTTTACTSANLSQARQYVPGVNGGTAKGYFAGGKSSVTVATTDKITFSTDTTAACTSADLSPARHYAAAVSEGLTKSYFLGGATGADVPVAIADKVTYSSDVTVAVTTANLSQARRYITGVSGEGTKGYALGGWSSAPAVTADKLTYSTDTTAAATTANLSQARYALAGLSEGTSKGYVVGGTTGAVVSTADKITFATDVTGAVTSANLSQARHSLAAASEGTSKGYVVGGNTGGYVYTADMLTFSTDITSARTSARLSQARGMLGGLSEAV